MTTFIVVKPLLTNLMPAATKKRFLKTPLTDFIARSANPFRVLLRETYNSPGNKG